MSSTLPFTIVSHRKGRREDGGAEVSQEDGSDSENKNPESTAAGQEGRSQFAVKSDVMKHTAEQIHRQL